MMGKDRARKRVAVIAGTKIDTQMGVDYINKKDQGGALEAVYCPVSEDCDAQLQFQYSSYDEKRKILDDIFEPEIEKGTRDFFVYCNSLSGAFDFDEYAAEKTGQLAAAGKYGEGSEEIRIYTPLQIYRVLGKKYKCIGVMAANNLSAFGIERALMTHNKDLYVIGTGNMSIVRAIEEGQEPQKIISACGLSALLTYMQSCGAEAVLLGCTHFPYIMRELQQCAAVPLIDPADLMYESVMAAE